jgi:hypothetical protein
MLTLAEAGNHSNRLEGFNSAQLQTAQPIAPKTRPSSARLGSASPLFAGRGDRIRSHWLLFACHQSDNLLPVETAIFDEYFAGE